MNSLSYVILLHSLVTMLLINMFEMTRPLLENTNMNIRLYPDEVISFFLDDFIAESGSLYIFNGGHNFPTGDATANCGSIFVQPCPDLKVSNSDSFLSDIRNFSEKVSIS